MVAIVEFVFIIYLFILLYKHFDFVSTEVITYKYFLFSPTGSMCGPSYTYIKKNNKTEVNNVGCT